MTKDQILDFCRGINGAETDQPFNEDFKTWVCRHGDSRKWFAAVMELDGKWFANLKCDPLEADFLRKAFKGVVPAYHMNKVHWNTVYLDSDVPDEEIRRMTLSSFNLTAGKKKKR